MGICVHCGQSAGPFRSVHAECRARADEQARQAEEESRRAIVAERETAVERPRLVEGAPEKAANLTASAKRATIRRATIAGMSVLHSFEGSKDAPIAFLRAFVHAGGLILDPSVWHLNRRPHLQLMAAIELALRQGLDPHRAANEFFALSVAEYVLKMKRTDELESGLSVYEYLVDLFVAEINRANSCAYMIGASKSPAVVGFRFMLSPRHEGPDIENLLATQNLYGLGGGVYPTPESMPSPARENTLSFAVAVFPDDVSDGDRAGRETSLDALARMSPELRASILGPTKARYLDRGLLRSWMVRSPLDLVQRRLVRQGLIDGDNLEVDPSPEELDDE